MQGCVSTLSNDIKAMLPEALRVLTSKRQFSHCLLRNVAFFILKAFISYLVGFRSTNNILKISSTTKPQLLHFAINTVNIKYHKVSTLLG